MSEQLKNYYSILELGLFESSQNAIKNSYLKVTQKYHPSCYFGADLPYRLIDINEAFLVLSDYKAKGLYDRALSAKGDIDYTELDNIIKIKRAKAELFISNYFNGTQKKKTSVGKSIGIALLVMMIIGTLGRIASECKRQYESVHPQTAEAITLPSFTTPPNWNKYNLYDKLSLSVPPSMELRSDYDKYTKFLNEHNFAVSNSDLVFQQRDLSNMTEDAFNTYCRVLVAYYYVGADNATHSYESLKLNEEDYRSCRSIADEEIKPWSYISYPKYEWIDIQGTKAIDIKYSREGTDGEVICHIYLFFNYDEFAKIVTAYRKVNEDTWENDINNVIKTFKWTNPK